MNRKSYIKLLIILLAVLLAGCAHVSSGSPAAGFVREGLSLFNTGRFDESAILFRRAYAADPYYAPAYMMLGRVYLAKSDTYRAEIFFRKSLSLDDSAAEIFGWLGDIYWCEGDTVKAMEYYGRCPKDDPHYAVLHYQLGIRDYQDGRSHQAREEFEKALAFPEFWGGHYGLGLLAYIDGDFVAAAEHLKTAECDSADSDYMYWLGKSYLKIEREPEAYLYFKRYTRSKSAKSEFKREADTAADNLAKAIAGDKSSLVDSSNIIPFVIEKNTDLCVGIYDFEGRLVKMLFTGCITRGEYTLEWNGTDSEGDAVDDGIYLGFVDTKTEMKLYPMRWDK